MYSYIYPIQIHATQCMQEGYKSKTIIFIQKVPSATLNRQYCPDYFHTQKNVCIHLFHTIYRFTDGCVARAPHFPFWKTLKRERKLELTSENIK